MTAKAALNMTPAQAGKLVRINHAKFLLSSTAQTVTEIADDTGYCNSSHFVQAFRAVEGQTPTQFRRSLSDAGKQ